MKIFEYDINNGKKGTLIMEMCRPTDLSNKDLAECKLPAFKDGESWMIATEAKNRNAKIAFDRPVCFCMGQWTAGIDTAWQWVVLLPN